MTQPNWLRGATYRNKGKGDIRYHLMRDSLVCEPKQLLVRCHCDKNIPLANGKFAVLYKPLMCSAMLSSRCKNWQQPSPLQHESPIMCMCACIEYDLKPDPCQTAQRHKQLPICLIWKMIILFGWDFCITWRALLSAQQPGGVHGRLNNMTTLLCYSLLI